MGLLRNAGRAIGQSRGFRVGAVAAIGGGAVISGVGSALTDPEGSWQRDIFPDAQEMAFGHPRAVQESMRGGITAAIGGADDENVLRDHDYYYSRPVNLRGNSKLNIPVSGEIVFGAYNRRLGS